MDLGKFEKKEYFVNRELSWLKETLGYLGGVNQ